MLISTNAIVLSKLKYGDNDLIVKCYTKERGTTSFLLKNVLKSKKAQVKKAYFQELSHLQIDFRYKQNRELHLINTVKANSIYSSLHSNVLKSSVVIFISEVLSNILREEEKNEALYDYLDASLSWFDMQPNASNFHLLFLLELTRFLGFYPDISNLDRDYFNMEEGKFERSPNGSQVITGENLMLLKQFLGTTFDALNSVKINSNQRQTFLNLVLLYYKIHLGSFKQPKSLAILNQVFN